MLEGMALAIDRLMVSLLLNPEDYAVFANGAMEVPLIAAITVAAGAVMLPEIVRAFGKGDASEALSLWQLMVRRGLYSSACWVFIFYLFLKNSWSFYTLRSLKKVLSHLEFIC